MSEEYKEFERIDPGLVAVNNIRKIICELDPETTLDVLVSVVANSIVDISLKLRSERPFGIGLFARSHSQLVEFFKFVIETVNDRLNKITKHGASNE